ncbi:MAG TPA: acyl-CoA dehydrogenase family protein, partial [Pararhizobium sp.]|nr:acyl-CoA dehydrogenase family protein [Pararhizobium sp.]
MNVIERVRPPAAAESVSERMRRVAEIAAAHADAADREGRFPAETVAALKAERLLGVALPIESGGEGLGTMAIAELIVQLGQA